MKIIKRFLVLQFLVLLIIPIAFAEISITLPEKDVYNLGDKIIPTISIKENKDYDGFFSLHIICGDYELQYYTTPLSLEADTRTQLTIPELHLFKPMTGSCKLRSNFEESDGDKIDSVQSDDFSVTDKINIEIDGQLEAKPGEDVLISGEIKKHSNEILPKGEVVITFGDKEDKIDIVSGNFEHTIHLSNDAKTRSTPILIVAKDKYGNYADKLINLEVLPIPTRIENRLENDVLMPGDTLKARVILYDHNNMAINGSKVNVKILDPDENLLAEKNIQSLNYFEFATQKSQIPGTYFLLSTFEDIKEQSTFTIQIIRKITMSHEADFIHIENVGNVNYDDKVTITLESDEERHIINKKIELKPGEKITIQLSKEVPQGTYDITLPEEVAEENVIKDVSIEDKRNVLKKTADGMSIITGAVVSTAGYIASKPILATIILVLITLGTVTYYSKDFIVSKIKRKKPEDTSHLFEDFKYEEKK